MLLREKFLKNENGTETNIDVMAMDVRLCNGIQCTCAELCDTIFKCLKICLDRNHAMRDNRVVVVVIVGVWFFSTEEDAVITTVSY